MTDTIQTQGNRTVKRDYLTEQEITKLLAVASKGRHGQRDALLILLSYRHGLRASEAVEMQWHQIDLANAHINVDRLKGSDSTVQPLEADEVRALKKLRAMNTSTWVFLTERGTPMTADGYLKMMKRLGKACSFEFNLHPHMLRHSCGFALVNKGTSLRVIQLYLGHRNLQHTALYTKLQKNAFKGLGKLIGGKL